MTITITLPVSTVRFLRLHDAVRHVTFDVSNAPAMGVRRANGHAHSATHLRVTMDVLTARRAAAQLRARGNVQTAARILRLTGDLA